jgi:hypothetical protein
MTDEKQEMRTQMAIMRGETELTKCQMAMVCFLKEILNWKSL